MATDSPPTERLLVAVDDSEAAERAVRYVGRIIGGRADFGPLLYHRLPPIPPEMRDHGGSENPEREAERSREQSHRTAEWVRSMEDQTRPVLKHHRTLLVEAGVAESAVGFVLDEDVTPGENLSDALRRTARARACHTVVIAREHLSGLREVSTTHVSDDLAHHPEGLAVWIVD